MGLLARSAAAIVMLASGCYSPDVRDCTVLCSAVTDCATGQICGSDHLCASPEIAGQCSTLPHDAGAGDRDGGMADAKLPVDAMPDAPPDAAPTAVLHVQIEGQGRVTVEGVGMCDAAGPQMGNCMFVVALAAELTATAVDYPGWTFDKWTTVPCITEPRICTFTPIAMTDLTAKFRKAD